MCKFWAVFGLLLMLTACGGAQPSTEVSMPSSRSTSSIAFTSTVTYTSTFTSTITNTATSTPTTSLALPTVLAAPITYTYQILHEYPHDPSAFTQGLVYTNGQMFESTGLYGRSSLREVELETGRVLRNQPLDASLFAEGLALVDGKLIQLTWQNQLGFVYEPATFTALRTFTYTYEGWGLAFDGQQLILSDGTPTLRFLDPITLTSTHQITVTDHGQPVDELNELEYVRGEVWGNIWQTNLIARIDPHTGNVLGWIDLTGLLAQSAATAAPNQPVDVLNGIAYDEANDRLFVTGKLWPRLFEIRLIPK